MIESLLLRKNAQKRRGIGACLLVLQCIFFFGGCSKNEKQGKSTKTEFTDVLISQNTKSLSNNSAKPIAPIADGGILIYAVGQGVDHIESMYLTSESDTGTMKIPNGTYKFYGIGYKNSTTGFGSITSTLVCAAVDNGQLITLTGGSKTISVHLKSSDCVTGDEFFPASLQTIGSPIPLKLHSCGSNSVPPSNCGGACSSCAPLSGDIRTYRVKLLNYKKVGKTISQKAGGMKACINAPTPFGDATTANPIIPFGGYVSSPFILEIGVYITLSSDCSNTPDRTYTLSNGLYSAYLQSINTESGDAILLKDGINPVSAHLYLKGGIGQIDQTDNDNDIIGGFGSGTYNLTQWNAVNSWLELTAAGLLAGAGDFLSRIIDAGTSVNWTTIAWVSDRPTYKQLPDNKTIETTYSNGLVNMTNNVMLFHMNEASWNGTASEVVDSSGTANHGTSVDGATTVTTGRFSQGGSFDGINDSIRINDSATLDITNNLSVEFWFKPANSFSNTSHNNLGLLDKGVFQLFLDKGDGRLKFSLTDNTVPAWATAYDGPNANIASSAVFNGSLYIGETGSNGEARVLVCDPTGGGSAVHCDNAADWTVVFTSADVNSNGIVSMATYNGKLYVGQEYNANTGDIFMCNPATGGSATICDNAADWSIVYDSAWWRIKALTVYNGKLYAGRGNTEAIVMCTPTAGGSATDCDNAADWSEVYTNTEDVILSFGIYNGRLYAGQGLSDPGDGKILMCTPTVGGSATDCDNTADWSVAFTGPRESILSFANFNGTFYAGQGQLNTAGGGDVYRCDPTAGGDPAHCDNQADWIISFDGAQEQINALAVYQGKLYAAQGQAQTGDGDIYVCDPTTAGGADVCDNALDWTLSYNGAQEGFSSFIVHNGRLYAGQNYEDLGGDGDLFIYGNNTVLGSTTAAWASTNWYHIAGTYDGANMRLFVNGIQESSVATGITLATNNLSLLLGKTYGTQFTSANFEGFSGTIDEVAIYNTSVLTASDALDRYLRGAVRLKFQVRSCDDALCAGETLVGPDGTAATFYTEQTNSSLATPSLPLIGIGNNRYFQYKAFFETDNNAYSPSLKSVTIGPAH